MRMNKTTSIDKDLHDKTIALLKKQGRKFAAFVDEAMTRLIEEDKMYVK